REEEQDDDDDEDAAIAQGPDDIVDRDFDEVRLPEDLTVDGHAGWQLRLKRVELTIQPRRELDGVGAWLFLDTDDHCRFAAARAFAALERRAFPHIGQITDEYRPSAS